MALSTDMNPDSLLFLPVSVSSMVTAFRPSLSYCIKEVCITSIVVLSVSGFVGVIYPSAVLSLERSILTFSPVDFTSPAPDFVSSLSRLMFPPKTVVNLARSLSTVRFGNCLNRLMYASVIGSASMSSVRNLFTISATMCNASVGVLMLPAASFTSE